MRSVEELEALAWPLNVKLSFEERVLLVYALGMVPAYCPGCLCTIGSPVCHRVPEIIDGDNEPQEQEVCPAPCHAED